MRLHGVSPPKPAYESLGARLKEVRKHHKLRQEEMAEILQISRSSYQYYERNERDMPMTLAKAFIEHFQLDAEWFIFGDAGRPEKSKKDAHTC